MTLKHLRDTDWNYIASFIVHKFALTSLPYPINQHTMNTYEAIKQEGKSKSFKPSCK